MATPPVLAVVPFNNSLGGGPGMDISLEGFLDG